MHRAAVVLEVATGAAAAVILCVDAPYVLRALHALLALYAVVCAFVTATPPPGCASCVQGSQTPPRSRHCRACGACCERRSHHCGALGVCIAEYNRRAFMLLQLSGALVAGVPAFVRAFKAPAALRAALRGGGAPHVVRARLCGLYATFALCALAVVLALIAAAHLWLVGTARVPGDVIHDMLVFGGLAAGEARADGGYARNCRGVFGSGLQVVVPWGLAAEVVEKGRIPEC